MSEEKTTEWMAYQVNCQRDDNNCEQQLTLTEKVREAPGISQARFMKVEANWLEDHLKASKGIGVETVKLLGFEASKDWGSDAVILVPKQVASFSSGAFELFVKKESKDSVLG